jgi:hypothetical protein
MATLASEPARESRRAIAGAAIVAALLAAAVTLGGCVQGSCPPGEDVVGCGGHWDQIYRQISYPESPG